MRGREQAQAATAGVKMFYSAKNRDNLLCTDASFNKSDPLFDSYTLVHGTGSGGRSCCLGGRQLIVMPHCILPMLPLGGSTTLVHSP